MVKQCKVEIHRVIYHCGTHSHVSVVNNGMNEYIMETSRDVCRIAHATGIFKITDTHSITGVKINNTIVQPVTLKGTIDNDGSCYGEGYSDPFGS